MNFICYFNPLVFIFINNPPSIYCSGIFIVLVVGASILVLGYPRYQMLVGRCMTPPPP